ncbi:MAG: CdaR family protein [Candidatus Eremiobacteraeota bacterium]|nr:CdaR family protein [Candidatus Eremiobacteraeota bacterium]
MRLTHFLKNNLGLKILCIILSMSLWAWVRFTQAPLSVRNESQTSIYLPVVYQNEKTDLMLTKGPDKVIITVKGPPQVIDKIMPEHFKAFVDLEGMTEGQNWVDVGVKIPPGLTVLEKQPSRAKIVLEKLERRSFHVKVNVVGAPKEGYVAGKAVVEPQEVEVSGAQSSLRSIKDVGVTVNVTAADMDLKQRVQPEPKDAQGTIVFVDVNPKYIKVDMPVRSTIRAMTLPVNPRIMDSPAQGYAVTQVMIEPPVATVLFPGKSTVTEEVLHTEAISLKNIRGDVQKQVNLIQPQGGTLMSQKSVLVKITIRKEGE